VLLTLCSTNGLSLFPFKTNLCPAPASTTGGSVAGRPLREIPSSCVFACDPSPSRLSPFRVLHFPTFARDRGVPGVWLSSVAGDVGVVGDDGVVKPPVSFSY
jgi:hypothetical protein